jgi:predicted transcriptional regulator of viral defense system
MKAELGQLETRFMAYAQMRRLQIVRLGELSDALQLTSEQERRLLTRLASSGMIARVRRGVYLLPPRLPLGGSWSPDEPLALTALMAEAKGRYQICGPNAFNRYGYDEQVPTRVYAYNNRISGERRVGSVLFTLIKVADKRLGQTETVRTSSSLKAVYSSRARTLLDAVFDWSRFDGLPRAYGWIVRDLKAKLVTPDELVRVAVRYGNQSSARRIGMLLEREQVPDECLRDLERMVRPSQSYIPWNPMLPKRGRTNRRWGVVVNDEQQQSATLCSR